ncbi:unnamed protein product [Symbiodinium sp. CCMP2592]|nr:unnamed protein product [Symbiodinium sp. CCMP2592]
MAPKRKRAPPPPPPPAPVAVDFWSWRAPDAVAAERVHMDADFWMTGATDGFNLWFLLDHKDMAHSFDIYAKEENPELYKRVRLPHRPTSLIPLQGLKSPGSSPCFLYWEPLRLWPVLFEGSSTVARELGMVVSIFSTWWLQKALVCARAAHRWLPFSVFRVLMALTGWLGNLALLPRGIELRTRKFPLSIGDALVVRQDELHVSDQDSLQDGQFRLAVGLKFMKQDHKVWKYPFLGPAGKSRRQYPALRLPWGRSLKDVYRQHGLDMSPYPESWLQRLFASSSFRQV